MKALMLLTSGGALVVLSSHESPKDPILLSKLESKGVTKYLAYELPVAEVSEKYGGHFHRVMQDLHETDDLRVLDEDGARIFRLFTFSRLGAPILCEPEAEKTPVFMD